MTKLQIFVSYRKYLIDLFSGRDQRTTKISTHLIYSILTIFLANLSTYLFSIILGVNEEYSEKRIGLNYSLTWFFVFLVGCIFPIIEELSFRLLLSLKKTHILISFSLSYAFFLSAGMLSFLGNEIANHFLFFVVISVFLFLKIFILLKVPILSRSSVSIQLINFARTNFQFIYFGSAILFGVLHLLFQSLYFTEYSHILKALFFLSYFISGLVFNSGRMAIGFVYVVFLHMALNLSTFL